MPGLSICYVGAVPSEDYLVLQLLQLRKCCDALRFVISCLCCVVGSHGDVRESENWVGLKVKARKKMKEVSTRNGAVY